MIQQRKTSSFQEMLEQEKRSKDDIFERLLDSEFKRAEEQKQHMNDIIEAAINVDLVQEIRDAVVQRIQVSKARWWPLIMNVNSETNWRNILCC